MAGTTDTLQRLFAKAGYTAEQVLGIKAAIPNLPPEQKQELFELIEKYERQQSIQAARESFLSFAQRLWPVLIGDKFIRGRHHELVADALQRIADGTLKRLIINLPPRSTKSEFGSFLFPAYYMGRYPDRQMIQATHTSSLSYDFGAKVRNLIKTAEFQEVWPGVLISPDKKAAGRWNTNKGGRYFAVGTHGSIAGRGADVFVLDDPISEKQALDARGNPDFYDRVYAWYTQGPLQRLQPDGAIIVLMTRWSKVDVAGRLIDRMIKQEDSDQWEVIQVPAIMPSGNSYFPEMWTTDYLLQKKANMPVYQWNAQYQQDPTSEEGAIVKREWWNNWEWDYIPKCDFVIQSWDTALTKSDRANYSACTTWGVFYIQNEEGRELAQILLLEAINEKMEMPDLKQRALEAYNYWKPDSLLVEKKGSGFPLIYELRQLGIPVQEFVPSRGNDKMVRVNAVSDLFRGVSVRLNKQTKTYEPGGGIVWAPVDLPWANEVMEQFAAFPHGENDDLVDASTCALLRFRQGGFVRLESDEEEKKVANTRRHDYY